MAFTLWALPREASPRLKGLQIAQLSVVGLTIFATFLAAVIPQKHKVFTFGLLYSLIFTSVTTTVLIRKEQAAAKAGALTKDKYAKYQLYKMASAAGLYVLGFVAFLASTSGNEQRKKGESGMWIGGVKVNRYQGWIIWLNIFNW
jgi:hypothetical protein